MGIWDIAGEEEARQDRAVASAKIVLGYCVGNERLGGRYNLEQLSRAVHHLKAAIGKPVTITGPLSQKPGPPVDGEPLKRAFILPNLPCEVWLAI